MPEWWTYGLSDFLLFSPRTYYRLLERQNEALWPAQFLAAGLGLGILGLLLRPVARQKRVIPAILAMAWAWVAWAFLWRRYATINWAVKYAVPVFAFEALLLIWIGVVRGRVRFLPRRDASGRLGVALVLLSLALYPALAALAGRPWGQAEIFGLTPDPTALATVGLLLLAEGRVRWELLAAPILWCLGSGATLWAMKSPEALLLLPASFLGIVAASRQRPANTLRMSHTEKS